LKEDFAMSPELDKSQTPELDKSQSPEFSQPYRLLAPLVLLSFPTSIALPSPPPHTGWMSEVKWRETATDPFGAMMTR
jgi:hypothetical protein